MNNIVDIWNKFFQLANSGTLSANEQITLVHIIGHINRNMWKETKIEKKIIAAAISKDVRTVKTAIKKLVNLGIITETEGGFNIGGQPKPKQSRKRAAISKSARDDKTNYDEEQHSESDEEQQPATGIDRGRNSTSRDNVRIPATSTRRRRIFH